MLGTRSTRPATTAVGLLLAAVLLTVGLPTVALAGTGGGWSASGPDAVTTSDGSSAAPAFRYSSPADLSRRSGVWTFTTTATSAGTLDLPWTWTGDHGRTQVRSHLAVGIYRSGRLVQPQLLVDDGPSDCCPAGTTGFRHQGVAHLTVLPGDRYGFGLAASHSEKTGPLEGTLTLASPPTVTVPSSPPTATTTDPAGAPVSFAASAATADGSPLPVSCTPGSGSVFPLGQTRVTCSAASPDGLTASATFAVRVYALEPNVTWPTATALAANDSAVGTVRLLDQAFWYRFPVNPDSTVTVDLTGLGADYDLALFRDIGAAFSQALSTRDLDRLGAEFAADAYSPSAFSPSAFSPSAFSPSAFSPSAFSPSAFSPSAFSPSAFSPSAFSPSAFSPSAFSPSAFSPSAFSPDAPAGAALDPGVVDLSTFTPQQLSDAFSSAQVRSLVAVSAHPGLADESVRASTWGATGWFYVRVQGHNGAFAPGVPFHLRVTTALGACTAPLDTFAGTSSVTGVPGSASTVILTDSHRLPGVDLAGLRTFAARPEVRGIVVDAGTVPRLQALNDQADRQSACPYAKNLVAQALRDVVNSYRDDAGTLRYVVIAGGDGVVPFFRSADSAGLGPEQNYVPPVGSTTASEAALRRNQVLSQDAYGALTDVTLKGATVPVPDLAVGRLVETPAEIQAALDRYAVLGGVLPTPTSALVTGYDFLADSARDVAATLGAGLGAGGRTDLLVTDADVPPGTVTPPGAPPDRSHSWTAADLRAHLFEGPRHDLVYLAGHFSANNALAADFRTSVLSTEVSATGTHLADTLVLSAGCHSGYNLVDGDAVPGVTEPLDWVQALTHQGAVVLAGTGYQYGDTDLVEYSERLYGGVARQLRHGSGPVPLGRALTLAKQEYLASTPVLSGIHQKALAEATLYGLPMLGLDLPSGRDAAPVGATVSPTPVSAGPGAALGLKTLALHAVPSATTVSQPFTDPDGTGLHAFTYLRGPDGVVTAPGQPALPLQQLSVTAPGLSLRGVGFRGGSYTDTHGVVPLTGAATTETAEVHTAFTSPVFFPRRLALANTYGALAGDGGTRLLLTAAQHRSESATTSTLRRYSSLDYQLTYSANTADYSGNVPALAAPPAVTGVGSTVAGSTVDVRVRVVGDPSAGIGQVWLTRTAEAGPWYGAWSSVDLVQDPADSTLWTARLTLPAGQAATDVRFVVQAVNGVGLVTLDDNDGAEYVPGTSPGLDRATGSTPSALTVAADAPAVFGASLPVHATLTAAGSGLPGRRVTFTLGAASTSAVTDAGGTAHASLPLADGVGARTLSGYFDGDAGLAPATASSGLTVGKRPTAVVLTAVPDPVVSGRDSGVTALLTSAGVPLPQRAVTFVAQDGAGRTVAAAVGVTGPDGVAHLGVLTAPAGTYQLVAGFGLAGVDLGSGETAATTDPELGPSSSPARPLRVQTPPGIVTTTLADATAGAAYSAPLLVTGDPPPTVDVQGLPAGLSYSAGSVHGTATVAGSYPVTVTATSALGSAGRTLTLRVRPGAPASVTAVGGGGQAAPYGQPFPVPLVAEVADAWGNLVPGVTVTFASPATGAGTAPRTGTAVTGTDGRARLAVVAGQTPGAYDVRAATGYASAAAFRLANQYQVSTFAAPLDGAQPVPVAHDDTITVSAAVQGPAGPPDPATAATMVAGCQVTVTSRLAGTAAGTGQPLGCAVFEVASGRFTAPVSGTTQGWTVGSTYVLRMTVFGSSTADVLGVREVSVLVVR